MTHRLTLPAMTALAALTLFSAQSGAATPVTAASPPVAEKSTRAPEGSLPKTSSPDQQEKIKNDMFDVGKRAYDRADWLKAVTSLRPLVEIGDVRAMVLLGNMYAAGNGVANDHVEAFSLYHKAALLNNTDGMVATAAMYRQGDGVGINTRLALGWFERAARLGDQSGAFFYGIFLFEGSKGTSYDLKPDNVAAYKWFRLAATRGDNKKMKYQAYRIAEELTKKIPPDKVLDTEKEVKDWAPDTLEEVGPNPEEKLAKEMADKPKEPDNLTPIVPPVPPEPKKPDAKKP